MRKERGFVKNLMYNSFLSLGEIKYISTFVFVHGMWNIEILFLFIICKSTKYETWKI